MDGSSRRVDSPLNFRTPDDVGLICSRMHEISNFAITECTAFKEPVIDLICPVVEIQVCVKPGIPQMKALALDLDQPLQAIVLFFYSVDLTPGLIHLAPRISRSRGCAFSIFFNKIKEKSEAAGTYMNSDRSNDSREC